MQSKQLSLGNNGKPVVGRIVLNNEREEQILAGLNDIFGESERFKEMTRALVEGYIKSHIPGFAGNVVIDGNLYGVMSIGSNYDRLPKEKNLGRRVLSLGTAVLSEKLFTSSRHLDDKRYQKFNLAIDLLIQAFKKMGWTVKRSF
ncbi:MAG: hypothetical protein KGJ89_04500 [Patescibacteria group bacterium]|nr:hypothetical protein [Patescibacteria group bacterium]MDE2015812.1 hypothetical protein [Patescibacteria group bacterium]MDE2227187.1 hypothetical protein [Patescibacteria group bacterium]